MNGEKVVGMDDHLIEKLSDDSFDPVTLTHEELEGGIRRLTRTCSVTPLLCGSAFKNIGVQPLMGAITSYLPGPPERPIPMYKQ